MPDECPEISASFVVGGDDFDTAVLSQLIGLHPTRVWHQKIQYLRERSDISNCEWEYKLDKLECWAIDDAVQKVLDAFWEKKNDLNDFIASKKLKLTIALYVYNEEFNPEYVISLDTMKRLVECKAEFCMQLDE
ncbi:DUF4279 domain-containing protein [Thalassoglobus sp.]|uniref:DUF4279 domain-containing protein n=1 Tax=Thalassoglobus sp. TaxID=2795869 RepID=UPI003AA93D65